MILRRRQLWFVVLVGLVLAGGVWPLVLALYPVLLCKDAERIKDLMSKEEVRRILGRDPDVEPRPLVGINAERVTHSETWFANDGEITILFALDGIVIGQRVDYQGLVRCQWQRLCARFGH